MDDQLTASEESFRLMVDHLVDYAIFMVDNDGVVITWNDGAEHINGYSAKEMVGRHFSILYSEAEAKRGIPDRELEIAAAKGRFATEGWRSRQGGTQFWADVVITPIRDLSGKLRGFGQLMRDLTERRQIEHFLADADEDLERRVQARTSELVRYNHAIQKSEEQFRRVVEAAPNAIVLINQSGRIGMVNVQTERLFGYSRIELLGQSLNILVPERFRSNHSGVINSVFAAPPLGTERNLDLCCLHRDGSEFPVEVGLSPIETDDGTMTLSAIVDISDQKYREKHIRASLKEKDILLGEIHHRVKNNLQVICSLLELQSSRLTDETVIDMLRDSQNRVRSMALVYQILHQSHDMTKVEFDAVIESLVPNLVSSYRVDSNRIEVSTHTEHVLLPINSAIPYGLIVNELVSNALEHAFPLNLTGTVDVDLKCETDGQVTLSISDSGIGLPLGSDPQNAETFGWQLVGLLTNQLGGEMTVNPSMPTTFTIKVPRHG